MKLLYFAWVRQKVGTGEEDFSPGANVKTVGDLIVALRARGPNYAAAFADTNRLRAAVNQHHVDFDARGFGGRRGRVLSAGDGRLGR